VGATSQRHGSIVHPSSVIASVHASFLIGELSSDVGSWERIRSSFPIVCKRRVLQFLVILASFVRSILRKERAKQIQSTKTLMPLPFHC
jgi:hypothetical protein